MRISVWKYDPDYISDPWRYTVFLNNERLDSCVCTDDKAGEDWCDHLIAIGLNGNEMPLKSTISFTYEFVNKKQSAFAHFAFCPPE